MVNYKLPEKFHLKITNFSGGGCESVQFDEITTGSAPITNLKTLDDGVLVGVKVEVDGLEYPSEWRWTKEHPKGYCQGDCNCRRDKN